MQLFASFINTFTDPESVFNELKEKKQLANLHYALVNANGGGSNKLSGT